MAKKERTYANFGEYLYYAYANLQMLYYALKDGKPRYDRMCYMIRAKAFKAYKEGRWQIHGLMEKHSEELDAMDLPFNWRYIPVDYPKPEEYLPEKNNRCNM